MMLHWHPLDPSHEPSEIAMAKLDSIHADYDSRREIVAFERDLELEIKELWRFVQNPPDTALPGELLEASARLHRLIEICDGGSH